jgi:inosine-uridine nucleoside N-ribohydrolase
VLVSFDMETRDPDDALALCLLAGHPRVSLTAVTVNPGTPAQIAVVREILKRLRKNDVPVGARVADSGRDVVSPFHREWLGVLNDAKPDAVAHELLASTMDSATTLVTGAPLHNLRLLLANHPAVEVGRWVAQGGFAGDNIVPPHRRLPKFAGTSTQESYNFGHDANGALAALSSPRIHERLLVAKNVTHGVAWDPALQARLKERDDLTPGARLAMEAMDVYLRERPEGKLLHDPLAAAAALDPGSFEWAEVEVYRKQGRWGSRPSHATGTRVSVAVDAEKALHTLMLRSAYP